jgi:hypothetical protein
MENKIMVLTKDGEWMELRNCFVIGAEEFTDKVVYHKFMFIDCEDNVRDEILNKAGDYMEELKQEFKK